MSLKAEGIAQLLDPYIGPLSPPPAELGRVCVQLETYLTLLLKWNARLNLTAIRDPEQIVCRHFGESLFAGTHLFPEPPARDSVLDLGSGAGFPGLPIHMLRPDLQVTLAEARKKKAAFLHEVVRALGLTTEIWAGRVEEIPAARMFDVITLRAVDQMGLAVALAAKRARRTIAILGSETDTFAPTPADAWSLEGSYPVPGSSKNALTVFRRS